MKKRPSREISIFNLSMLDVIFSALGAILILFIISLETSNIAKNNFDQYEQELQNANAEISRMTTVIDKQTEKLDEVEAELSVTKSELVNQQKEMAQSTEELEKTKRELKRNQNITKKLVSAKTQLEKVAASAKKRGNGTSLGGCEVPIGTIITVRFFDHGRIDGDRVKVAWNDETLLFDLILQGRPGKTVGRLIEQQENFLNVTALNNGTIGDNTATVTVSPCKDGQPQDFPWNMTAVGQRRYIRIEGY